MVIEKLKFIVGSCNTPAFVYLESNLIDNIYRIKSAIKKSGIKNNINIYVSYFANSNPHIASLIKEHGLGLNLQSIEENEHLKKFKIDLDKIVSTTHLSKEDLDYFIDKGLKINVATISNLKELLYKKANFIGVRLDLSPESSQRHGIKPSQFEEIKILLKNFNRTLDGVHIYAGTRNEIDIHLLYQKRIIAYSKLFPNLKEINLGGGFNYDYKKEKENHFDWETYFKELKKNIDEFEITEELDFSIEPGRDILADSGLLIVKINGMERITGKELFEIFTDGSYVHMPSATITARQHKLKFFDREFNEIKFDKSNGIPGFLNGNTTLSSDRLFPGIVYFPRPLRVGDYIVLEDCGAYCATQHMEFLNKSPCPELILRESGKIDLISKRGELTDKIRNVPTFPKSIG